MNDKRISANSAPPIGSSERSFLEEELPHLTKKICAHWGSPQFESFVQSVLLDSRDGERKGLPWAAAQDLLFLNELSVAKRAIVAAEVTGMPYSQVFKRMMANLDEAQKHPHQSWSNPGISTDARSNSEGLMPSPTPTSSGARPGAPTAQRTNRPKKKGFWQKLFS